MSVTAGPRLPFRPRPRTALAAARPSLGAVAIVAAAIGLFVLWLRARRRCRRPRNPFGMGLREAAPVGTSLGACILAVQSGFYGSLQAGLSRR